MVEASDRKSSSKRLIGDKQVASRGYICQGTPSLDGEPKPTYEKASPKNNFVIQGVECNSKWLDRSLVIDIREYMNAVSFSWLATTACEDVYDIQELSPMQFLVTFYSSKAMVYALSSEVQPVSSFYFGLRQ